MESNPIVRAVALSVLLVSVASGQEAPRKELADYVAEAQPKEAARLAAELKRVQGELKKMRHPRAIIATRRRESELKQELDAVKRTDWVPAIDIEDSEPGQIGTLYSLRVIFAIKKHETVEFEILRRLDENRMTLSFREMKFLLYMPNGDITGSARTLTIPGPVKIIGPIEYEGHDYVQLATFAK